MTNQLVLMVSNLGEWVMWSRFISMLVVMLVLIGTGSVSGAATSELSPEINCDIIGPDLKAMKSPDAISCRTACAEDNKCRAWSFISGWNRCFLKASVKAKSSVRMYAGRIDRDSQSVGVAREGWDFDDSGKDFRKISPLDRPQDCSNACIQDARCQAFVYIQGYRVCWLKNSVGRWMSKVFSCGLRSD